MVAGRRKTERSFIAGTEYNSVGGKARGKCILLSPCVFPPGRENEASFLLFLFGEMGLGEDGDELEVDCRRVTSERSYHKELGVDWGGGWGRRLCFMHLVFL